MARPLWVSSANPHRGLKRAANLSLWILRSFERNHQGFLLLKGRTFQVASVPVDENQENIGLLSVGEYFDFSDLTTRSSSCTTEKSSTRISPTSLRRAGTRPRQPARNRPNAICACSGANWISLPMQSYGGGYVLLSFENVDEATAPIQSRLHKLFLTLALVCVLVAFCAASVRPAPS